MQIEATSIVRNSPNSSQVPNSDPFFDDRRSEPEFELERKEDWDFERRRWSTVVEGQYWVLRGRKVNVERETRLLMILTWWLKTIVQSSPRAAFVFAETNVSDAAIGDIASPVLVFGRVQSDFKNRGWVGAQMTHARAGKRIKRRSCFLRSIIGTEDSLEEWSRLVTLHPRLLRYHLCHFCITSDSF